MPANSWAISARTSGRAPTAKGTLTSWLTGANSKDKPTDLKEPSSTLSQDATTQAANARLVWSGEFNVTPVIMDLPLFFLFFFHCVSCGSKLTIRHAAGINRAALSMGCSNYGSMVPSMGTGAPSSKLKPTSRSSAEPAGGGCDGTA